MEKKNIIYSLILALISIPVVLEAWNWSAARYNLRYDVEIKMVLDSPPFTEYLLRNDEVNDFMDAYRGMGESEGVLDVAPVASGISKEFYANGKNHQEHIIFCYNYVWNGTNFVIYNENEKIFEIVQKIWESRIRE